MIDAEGRKIPWFEAAHIDDVQMASLMQEIVNRLFTFHMKSDDQSFREDLDRWLLSLANGMIRCWIRPSLMRWPA